MKKSPLDTMLRYWPVLLSVVGLIGFNYTLNMRVGNCEDENKSQQDWLMRQSSSNQDIKIAQARIEEQTKAAYEILQEIRGELRESRHR